MKTKNIMIVGVGGQGTLLTSRILGGVMLHAGYDVKLSEVHGMAQRGGLYVYLLCATATLWQSRLWRRDRPMC